MAMPNMGGSIGSSAADSTSVSFNTSRTDSRNNEVGATDGGVALNTGDKGTITLTDPGIVRAMAEVTLASLSSADKARTENTASVLGIATSATKQAAELANPDKSTGDKTLVFMGVIFVVGVLAWAYTK